MGALWLAKETQTPLQKKELFQLCKTILKSGRDYATRHNCPCPLMYSYYQVYGIEQKLCYFLIAIS